ncbi:hypothetical protein Q7P37_004778 [Cladosporium fusiforme]
MQKVFAYIFLLIGSIQAAKYGVGFTLSRDYAVASVAYESGSIWNVAHVQGSHSYSQVMDWAFDPPDHVETVSPEPPAPPGTPIEFICGTPLLELFSSTPVQVGMGLQPIYNKLPPWLGGYRPDVAAKALTDMVLALKTATESALGTKVSDVYITVPYQLDDRHFPRRMNYAASSVGLRHAAHTIGTAEAALRAHGLGGGCNLNHDGSSGKLGNEQLVLLLDHNSDHMTATLAVVDCTYSDRRILSSGEFGAYDLTGAREWYCDSEEQEPCRLERHDKLVGALHRLTNSPVKGFGDSNLTQVDHIVIVGDSAGDHRLRDALKETFGDRLDDLMRYAYDKNSRPVDPLYAAAGYAAQSSLNNTVERSTREL